MSVCLLASATTDLNETPLPEDISEPEPFSDSLSRVQRVAGSISARVRRALTPGGFAPVRVLVVDDHPDAAESLAVLLELLDCPVHVCLGGFEALAVAKQFDPQVCLLDLKMPGMDGVELALRLQALMPDRRFLLVATTALGDSQARESTALAGFHAHLVKPIDMPTLIAIIADWNDREASSRS